MCFSTTNTQQQGDSTQSVFFFHIDGWESTSLSEETDTDGEWVDMHHSSDEEQQEIVSPN